MMTDPSIFQPATPASIEVRTVIFTVCEDYLAVLLQSQSGNRGWTVPGTPLTARHSLEITAAWLQSHLTGVRNAYLEQLFTYDSPDDSAASRVSVVYFALVPANLISENDEETRATGWFPVDELPPLTGQDAEIVTYALRRLRYKLEYSAVGFELLPETFTLSELQHIYETILGEKLDKRNFRRRILEAGVIETTPYRRGGEGRPAQLYRYRPDAVAEVKARRLFP